MVPRLNSSFTVHPASVSSGTSIHAAARSAPAATTPALAMRRQNSRGVTSTKTARETRARYPVSRWTQIVRPSTRAASQRRRPFAIACHDSPHANGSAHIPHSCAQVPDPRQT